MSDDARASDAALGRRRRPGEVPSQYYGGLRRQMPTIQEYPCCTGVGEKNPLTAEMARGLKSWKCTWLAPSFWRDVTVWYKSNTEFKRQPASLIQTQVQNGTRSCISARYRTIPH